MTLSDLASIGSFLSGLAVVISLIYLALQVRHAEKTQRALMHQARTERIVNAALSTMQPDIADAIAKMASGAELSPRETMQIYYYMRIQVCVVEDALWQHDAGFLDQESLDTAILTLKRVMLFAACSAAWFVQRKQIAPALRLRIDTLVAASLAAEPWDWTEDYKAANAQARAATPQTPTQVA